MNAWMTCHPGRLAVRRISRRHWMACVVGTAGLLFGSMASAAMSPDARIQEAGRRVERAIAPLGETESAERLAAAFRIAPRTVIDLLDQKLDLAQVCIVLALAQAGGTSSDTILSLWASGRLGWGDIAERLKVNLRDLLQRLENVRRSVTRRGG